jgi:hypothetical protein
LEKLLHINSRAVVLSREDISKAIDILYEFDQIRHLFNIGGCLCAHHLLLTLEKTVDRSRWGFHPYLASPKEQRCCEVTSYPDQGLLLHDITACAARASTLSDLPHLITTIASELLMNAVFNAPCDPVTQEPRYVDRPRNETIHLGPAEKITLQYGYDEKSFVIAVSDNFGRLTRKDVIKNLYRCVQGGDNQIRRETKGAGAGLFMVANLANQLDVHIDPGRMTQVVAVVHLSKKQINYELGHTSINFFKAG